MKIKGITDECISDYKFTSMYIAFPSCTFKCDKENGCALCQNSALSHELTLDISRKELIERYLANPLTHAIVCGGLEPFDSELDLLPFISTLRRDYKCDDTVVIYTGYTEEELESGNWGNGLVEVQKIYWNEIKNSKNIIVKFGRFRPDETPHYDKILGVNLASNNQYAKEYL